MRPTREQFRQADQTYFVTFQTARRQPLFRHERWANLLLETFERHQDEFQLHDFVIMPDHVHLLVSPHAPIERIVQLIKGGYSFSARKAFQWNADIWQAGFSNHRIRDHADSLQHIAYIQQNIARLREDNYEFCGVRSRLFLSPLPQWLKPLDIGGTDGGAKAPPLPMQRDRPGA